jgi:hypothetical protein
LISLAFHHPHHPRKSQGSGGDSGDEKTDPGAKSGKTGLHLGMRADCSFSLFFSLFFLLREREIRGRRAAAGRDPKKAEGDKLSVYGDFSQVFGDGHF